MVAFHFHCSGPGEVVIDVIGSRMQGGAEFFYGARRAAREVLSLYPSIDPSRWHVTIQDGAGFQVEAYRFDEVLRTPREAVSPIARQASSSTGWCARPAPS